MQRKIATNSTYLSMNEFKQKLLPDNSVKNVADNLEEAQNLGKLMARESIAQTRFELHIK